MLHIRVPSFPHWLKVISVENQIISWRNTTENSGSGEQQTQTHTSIKARMRMTLLMKIQFVLLYYLLLIISFCIKRTHPKLDWSWWKALWEQIFYLDWHNCLGSFASVIWLWPERQNDKCARKLDEIRAEVKREDESWGRGLFEQASELKIWCGVEQITLEAQKMNVRMKLNYIDVGYCYPFHHGIIPHLFAHLKWM